MPPKLTPEQKLAIGERIATLREIQEMTQDALARKVNVTQPAVSQWETGILLPRRMTQFDVADALGTTRSRLFREVAEAECRATGQVPA